MKAIATNLMELGAGGGPNFASSEPGFPLSRLWCCRRGYEMGLLQRVLLYAENRQNVRHLAMRSQTKIYWLPRAKVGAGCKRALRHD